MLMRCVTAFISYASVLRLSSVISAKIHSLACVAAWNLEKFTKNPYFGG